MKKFILFFLSVFITGILFAQNNNIEQKFFDKADKYLDLITVATNRDAGLAANKQFIAFLQENKSVVMNLSDTSSGAGRIGLVIAKSWDKNLWLVSWNSMLIDNATDFITMAIYNTPAGIQTQILRSIDDTIHSSISPCYDTLFTLKSTDDKTIYLARGFAQSNKISYYQVQAFEIGKDSLVNPKIFLGANSSIDVTFGANQMQIPSIGISTSGKTILVPETTTDGGFANKYQQLIFDGKEYIEK
jgi:hypothetical protein